MTVTVADGGGTSDSETFSVSVAANQTPELAPIGNQVLLEEKPFSLMISATDADGPAPLVFTQTNTLPGSPNILTDFGNGTARLDWTPAAGDSDSSPYSVTVTVTDGQGAADTETITVEVISSQPPVICRSIPCSSRKASRGGRLRSLGITGRVAG